MAYLHLPREKNNDKSDHCVEVEPDMAPIQFAEQPGIVRAQLKLPTEKTDCTIGEKVWGGRGYYGGFRDFPR